MKVWTVLAVAAVSAWRRRMSWRSLVPSEVEWSRFESEINHPSSRGGAG